MGRGAATGPLFHDGRAGDGLSDGAARLAVRYPRVWHVIEADGAGAWLTDTGLLPAAELYRLAGLEADGTNRDAFQRIEPGPGQIAILRPQPMADQPLAATLAGSFAGCLAPAYRCTCVLLGGTATARRFRPCLRTAAGTQQRRAGMGTSARACDRDLNAALPPRRKRLFRSHQHGCGASRWCPREARRHDLCVGWELPVGAGGGAGNQGSGDAARIAGHC